MRTIIELPDQEAARLDRVARTLRISRTEAVRRAVKEYNRQHSKAAGEVFGLWRGRRPAGTAYQRKLREEWDR